MNSAVLAGAELANVIAERDALRAQIECLEQVMARDLAVLRLAYRKHQLGDESIGWDELGDRLCDRICDHIGGDAFAEWVEEVCK